MLTTVQLGILSALLVLSVHLFDMPLRWLEALGYVGGGWIMLKLCVLQPWANRGIEDMLLIVGSMDARLSSVEMQLNSHLSRQCRRKADL